MSELPKAPYPARETQSPAQKAERDETDTEPSQQGGQLPSRDKPVEGENPHIGDVLADPGTNGKQRG